MHVCKCFCEQVWMVPSPCSLVWRDSAKLTCSAVVPTEPHWLANMWCHCHYHHHNRHHRHHHHCHHHHRHHHHHHRHQHCHDHHRHRHYRHHHLANWEVKMVFPCCFLSLFEHLDMNSYCDILWLIWKSSVSFVCCLYCKYFLKHFRIGSIRFTSL